ncbi:hypothetical protein GPALN_003056 [Globodera pallida]|nr:hypothetical protein GPALN_003056 [Globodera pallida]
MPHRKRVKREIEFKETPSKNVNLRDEEKLKQHKGKNNRQKKSSATGHKNRQFERIGKNIKLYKRLPKAPRGPPKHPERDERWRKKRYKNHKADDIGGGGGRPSLRLGQRRGSSYLYVNKKNKMRARTRPREREAVTERAAAARKWEQLKDRLEVERKIARAQRKRRRLDYTESKRPAAAATTKRRRNSVSIREGGRRLRPIDQQEQQQHTFSSSADSDDDNYSDELAWGRESKDGRINRSACATSTCVRTTTIVQPSTWPNFEHAKYFSHTAEEKIRKVFWLIEAFTNLASNQELACIYAALALQQDDGVPILAEKLQAMVEVAGVSVEPFWAGLYAKGLQGVDVKALIYNIGSGVGSAPAAAAVVTASSAGGGAAAPAAVNEEKKNEESKEELDDDMGFGLFD